MQPVDGPDESEARIRRMNRLFPTASAVLDAAAVRAAAAKNAAERMPGLAKLVERKKRTLDDYEETLTALADRSASIRRKRDAARAEHAELARLQEAVGDLIDSFREQDAGVGVGDGKGEDSGSPEREGAQEVDSK